MSHPIQNSIAAPCAQGVIALRPLISLQKVWPAAALLLLLAGMALPAAAQNVQVSLPSFPVTAVSQTASQTVTLYVTTDDISILALGTSSSGGDSEFYITDYGTCAVGTYVSAGTSCTFTLVFSPQMAGSAQSPAPIGRWGQVNLVYTDEVSGGRVYPDYPVTGSASIPTPVLTPGLIADLVGNDTTNLVGFAGDGGPASGAVFSQPGAIAMDGQTAYHNPQGNLYIADTNNAVVRVVYQTGNVPPLNNPVQGNIYTIAGVAPTGSVAQPGPGQDVVIATQSHLNNPAGVAVDPLGDVYIADSGNNAIRTIKAYTAGYIFTVAGTLNAPGSFGGDGGPAISANLFTPKGIAVDGYGNLYIADSGNNAIRVVYQGGAVLANLIATEIPGTVAVVGNIYTIAGGPNNVSQTQFGDGQLARLANLSAPGAVTVDSSGDIYIADYGNVAVRRVDAITGLISTIQIGVDNPTSLSVDAADDIYFTGQNACAVYQYNPSIQAGLTTPYVSVVAGGTGSCVASGDGGSATSAGLGGAAGVVVGGLGNLYVLEADGVRVVSGQQASFNYGTVNISNGGVLSATVTDENILPAPGSPTVVDYSNPAFAVVYANPQNYSIAPFLGVNTNIGDCDGAPGLTYLSSGTSCGVEIAFQPATDGGPFSGGAYSYGLGSSIALTGSGTGTLTSATLVGPSVTFLAEVNQGPSAAQVFILTNTGSSTLRVASMGFASGGGTGAGSFSLSNNCPAYNSEYVLAAGAACQITVTFTATVPGPVTASLQVTDNASTGSGVQTVALNASGVAPLGVFTNPAGTAAVANLTFAATAPGSSATGTATLTNLGTVALNINPAGFALAGTNPGAFAITGTTCGAGLGVGTSCAIGLTFSPPQFTYATFNATLVVQDDSGGTPLNAGAPTYLPQNLPLIGPTGSAPVQTSSFTLQNGTFPLEQIGTSTTQTASLVLNAPSNVVSIGTAAGSEFIVGTYTACAGTTGTTCAVPITFTPTGVGNRSGTLIVTNLESGVAVPYALPLSGRGAGTLAALTPGIISTVVGGNGYQTTGIVGVDGPAAQAQIGPVGGLVLDPSGQMFIAAGNQTIFKVDIAGKIHLYAGTGAGNGMAGDGGPALAASLAYTGPMALDAKGGLYVGDSDAPQFDDPARIRYIDPATGTINTVVGYYATFSWYPNFPYQTGMKVQINFGGVQYLFRAEPGGTSGSTNPNWPPQVGATIVDGSIIWVNEGVYTETNGCPAQIDMLGDGCLAQDVLIGTVTGLAVDTRGNLYFAETGLQFDISQNMYHDQPATVEVEVPHSMIRRVDAVTGLVSIVAGTGNETTYTGGYNVSSIGIPGYTGDGGPATQAEVNATAIAFDSKGNLFFIQDGRFVRRIDASTGNISTVSGSPLNYTGSAQCSAVSPEGRNALAAQYTLLTSIAFDAADNMYLTDANACVVRRIDAGTQSVYTVAGLPNSTFPLSNFGYGDSGQPNSDGSALEAELSTPIAVQIDSQANIYIASGYNGGVRKVDVSKSVLPFAGPFGQPTYTQETFTVSAPLTATVMNAGNSGTLQFNSPFLSPSWGISSNNFIRDTTSPTGAADCYDMASIPSGFECPISVDFTPQFASPSFVTAQDTVNDNSPSSPQVIQLSGIGFGDPPTVRLEPSLVSLFTPQSASSAPQPVTLINDGTTAVPISAIAITGSGSNAWSQTNNCGSQLAAVSACTIYITFSPPYLGTTTPPDTLKATLAVTDAAGNSPQTSQLVGVGTAPIALPLTINEVIDVSDGTPVLTLATLLPILETINVSDADLTVGPAEPTSITLSGPSSPQLIGATVQLIAQVKDISDANIPTGNVAFSDGSIVLGFGTLDATGAVTYTVPGPPATGTHSYTAVYQGAPQFITSTTATPYVLVVNQYATQTVLTGSSSPQFVGSPVQLTAQVTDTSGSIIPAGSVAFSDGAIVLGFATVNASGMATYTPPVQPAVGTHSYTAVYAGTTQFAGSTSNPYQLVVQGTIAVTVSNVSRAFDTANPGFSYTLTGSGSASVSGVPAITTTAQLQSPAGSYPITASLGTLVAPTGYSFTFVPGALTVTGNAPATITFSHIPNIPLAVHAITLTAHSTTGGLGQPITYSVTGPASISGSTLTLTGTGTVTVTASQAGNATFNAATSVSQSFQVTP